MESALEGLGANVATLSSLLYEEDVDEDEENEGRLKKRGQEGDFVNNQSLTGKRANTQKKKKLGGQTNGV